MSAQLRLIIILSSVFFLFSCDSDKGPKKAAKSAAIPVAASAIQTVSNRTLSPGFKVPAAIEASQIARVQAQVQATLTANHFTGGEIIEQGKLLVELDEEQLKASVLIAEANVQAAKAKLEETTRNYERGKGLIKSGDISQLAFDQSKSAFETAKANVAKSNAALNQAEINLQYTKIYAPFSGKISRPGHAVGDLVSPASPVPLFELVQLDPIYAISSVRLSQYNEFVAAKLRIEEEGGEMPEVEVTFELAGGVVYPHSGKFEAWSHTSESTRGMIAARVLVPNPDGQLLPGQIVSMVGKAVTPVEGIVVPQKAVFMDQQGHFVRILDDENKVARTNIEVGIRDGTDWIVRSGLSEGQRVIVEGSQRFPFGTEIAVQE